MGDVTNIDREDANAKSDIDYMCVYVRVCVCVCSHQARRVIFVSDVVSDEGRNNSTRKIHQLF